VAGACPDRAGGGVRRRGPGRGSRIASELTLATGVLPGAAAVKDRAVIAVPQAAASDRTTVLRAVTGAMRSSYDIAHGKIGWRKSCSSMPRPLPAASPS
jgi:hypothetical protein